jgi:hypothetical protein
MSFVINKKRICRIVCKFHFASQSLKLKAPRVNPFQSVGLTFTWTGVQGSPQPSGSCLVPVTKACRKGNDMHAPSPTRGGRGDFTAYLCVHERRMEANQPGCRSTHPRRYPSWRIDKPEQSISCLGTRVPDAGGCIPSYIWRKAMGFLGGDDVLQD